MSIVYILSRLLPPKLFWLLLLVPILFIVYPLLQQGAVVNGDFPYGNTLRNYGHEVLWMWIENGSNSGFDTIVRLPINGLLHLFVLLGVSSDVLSKLMIITGFLIASFSFYFSFVFLFKDKPAFGTEGIRLHVAALLGSLLYAYNPWSFSRVGHWYFWIGYCMLPIFLISLIYLFRDGPKWKYMLIAVGTWSLAAATPHMIVFYFLVLATVFLYFFLRNLREQQKRIIPVKSLSLIIALFLLSNMYWVYPFILAERSVSLSPSWVAVTEESTLMLSRDSSLFNVVRLLVDWVQNQEESIRISTASPLFPAWLTASLFMPILVFSSFLLVKRRKTKYLLPFVILAIVGIFLCLGNQGEVNNLVYSALLFHIPLISNFNWIFRDPDKWTFLIALGYSFCIGVVSFEILSRLKNAKFKKLITAGFFFVVLGSMMLYPYPAYKTNFEKQHNPIVLPNNIFENLNEYLMNNLSAERVYFMPPNYNSEGWRQGHEVAGLHQYDSAKPSIQTASVYPNVGHYYNYLTNAINSNETANIKGFIYPLGTSYIIYENDTTNPQSVELLKRLLALNDTKDIDDVGFFEIIGLDGDNKRIGQVNVPDQNVVVAGGLDKFSSLNSIDSFSSADSSVVMLDQYLSDEKYNQTLNLANSLLLQGDSDNLALSFVDDEYVIKPFEMINHHDPGNAWSKASTVDPLHGEFHPHTSRFGVDTWEFDYGKGLVLTWAKDNLTLPIDIKDSGSYDLYIRYMKNQEGGAIKLSVDDKPPKEIITKDSLNFFTWDNIGKMNLTKGSHVLNLENLGGFNAVNILAIIPEEGTKKLLRDANILAEKTQNMYLLEGESSFYSSGKPGEIRSLFNASMNESRERTITGQFRVPEDVNLMSLELLPKKIRPEETSSYTIKNLEIRLADQTNQDTLEAGQMNAVPAFVNNFDIFETAGQGMQNITENRESLEVQLGKTFSRVQRDSIRTEPFSVQPDKEYNYAITIEGTNLNYFQGFAYFLRNNTIEQVQTANNYNSGLERSGKVLSLAPKSEIFSNIDVLKPSNYTLALRAKTCETCGFLRINLGDKTDEISLKTRVPSFNWLYYNTYLDEGEHKLKIYSESNTQLDSAVIYDSTSKKNESIEDVFNSKQNPAHIIEYRKIDPTKHVIKINSEEPYILSFAEAYDPLWTAYVDGKRVDSNTNNNIPLYSIVNGFFVNKHGVHIVSIEYEPQNWFHMGAIVSLITIFAIPIAYILTIKWQTTVNLVRKAKSSIGVKQSPCFSNEQKKPLSHFLVQRIKNTLPKNARIED